MDTGNHHQGGMTMHKYRLEVTKNGITKSTVINSDGDWAAVWSNLWEWFNNGTRWAYGNVMVNNPDIVQLFEIPNDAEAAAAANKATA